MAAAADTVVATVVVAAVAVAVAAAAAAVAAAVEVDKLVDSASVAVPYVDFDDEPFGDTLTAAGSFAADTIDSAPVVDSFAYGTGGSPSFSVVAAAVAGYTTAQVLFGMQHVLPSHPPQRFLEIEMLVWNHDDVVLESVH